jgi:hypothetical protein
VAATERLPFRFFRYNDGHALVEERTGAIVDLLVSDEGISATVDLTPLEGMRAALDRQPDDRDAVALAAALDRIESAPPTRVYHLHYRQTPGSVAEIAALTRDELVKLDWAERYVPRAMGGLGLVLMTGGVLATLHHRRAKRPAPGITTWPGALPSPGARAAT